MTQAQSSRTSRRRLLALAGISTAATVLTRRALFAEEEGVVPTMINAAAKAKITVHRLRRNISVLEGSGGNIAVLTGKDGKLLVDAGYTPEEARTVKVYKGVGCATCGNKGYKGRVGLYEVMEISEGIRDLIMVGATAVELKRKALEEGMLTLRMSGLEKIKQGITTVEEVLRETIL